MSEELKCPICGKETELVYGKYPRKDKLCKEHAKALRNSEIKQCEICNNFYEATENCKCQQNEQIKAKANTDELTCIICGKSSNGKHFCYNCYKAFSNKVLYIQVKKCKEFTKLDAEYESDFTCEDGHLVKSPYEKIIDDWLYREDIKHAYEKKIDIDETHDITPDFFIPEYKGTKNIYIEFWGYGEENIQYQKRKAYKTNLYPELIKKENISVVYLTKKDVENDNFKKKIKYAKQGEIKE